MCALCVLFLQLVEKIMDCSRAGKLQEVVAEKRSVLTSMQQVLQSCYALLDSTQVPLHSIIRLLQHILRWVPSCSMLVLLTCSCGSSVAALLLWDKQQAVFALLGECFVLLSS